MAIHCARYTLAMIALVGLVGCQSSGGSNTALSKSNPFSSKTAASGSTSQYPPKPSTQVPNPTGTNTPAASGMAANPGLTGPSSNYGATTTSFNSLSAGTGSAGTTLPGSYAPGSQLGTGASTAGDPLVSPQRGRYASSASTPTALGATAIPSPSVTTNPYVSGDVGAARSMSATSGGFKSGARDYTSGATDYTASATSGASRASGAIIPRYGAAADRYGTDAAAANPAGTDRLGSASGRYATGPDPYRTTPDRSSVPSDRYGSTPRSGSSYDPIANARAGSGTPFGPASGYPNSAPAAGSRDGLSDPFQSASRPSAMPGSSAPAADRSFNPYSNAYPAVGASRPAASANDRGAAPSYPDYTSASALPSSRNNSYNPPAGSNVPGANYGYAPLGNTGYNPPASGYSPGNTGYNPPASNYSPGNTGYNPPAGSYPPASDYRPGGNGYSPPNASPYRDPNSSATPGAAPAADDDPHYRPGSTSDYVPRSSTSSPAASSMARAPSDTRIDSAVKPAGYSSGAADYLR